MYRQKSTFIFYALVILALLPIMLFRDFTPANELRYLSIADEALRNGSVFAFTLHGVPYADKPPLYLWLVMLGRLVLGRHAMIYLSLLSFVPAVVTTEAMVSWSGLRGRGAMLLRMMMLGNGLFLVSSLTVRMDMLMTMFIVLACKTFYDSYASGSHRLPWRFSIYVFLAVFTKGPLGLLIPLAAIATFLWRRGRLRDFPKYVSPREWGVWFVLTAAWMAGVYFEGGSSYLYNLTVHQTLGRAFSSFHHRRAWFYYALVIWGLLMPWLLLIIGGVAGVGRRVLERNPSCRFFCCAGVAGFIVLSAISSKLAIYLLPIFPFLITLGTCCLVRVERLAAIGGRVSQASRVIVDMGVLLPAAILLLAPAVPLLFPSMVQRVLPLMGVWPHLAGALLSLSALFALRAYHLRALRWAVCTCFVGIFVAALCVSPSLPALNARIGYSALCREAAHLAEQRGAHGYVAMPSVKHAENIRALLPDDGRSLMVRKKGMDTSSLPHGVVVIDAHGSSYRE